MSSTLQIGPLALPWSLLLIVLAVLLGHTVGRRVGRASGVDPEPQTFRLLLLALLAARLGFIWPYRGLYLDEPLRMLDIRDGGWDAQVGLITGWLATLVWVQRRPALRRPLLAAVGSASLLWLLGTGLLLWQTRAMPPLPAVSVARLDGSRLSLPALRGQPTVINLWASWCPPCRREMPVLAAAQAAHPEVRFVFINQGEAADAVQAFLTHQSPGLQQVLLDPRSEVGASLGQRALPTTFFFDAQGRLVDQRIGELSPATLAQRLARLNAGATAAPTSPPASLPSP
ncbi:TlpA family protein disulfide reductase [Ideonella sp. B7]|uniref:TlpA family protein disulfide reductase n=1 Tax=Ideonella benzenivorans TaxID=2831643 RepID=UPI001CECCDED|nr:TlpA disulfide reductase family protein [Ideonella benzenivorans]MCA6216282.1 TlpA family protein disulfide reductase [Ideonella benzenivorans]